MTSEVLCWNCSVKTKYGSCHSCGVEIVDPNTKKEEEEVLQREINLANLNYLEQINPDYYAVYRILLILNVVVYIFTSILSRSLTTSNEVANLLGTSRFAIEEGRYYVILTSMFTHLSLIHIFFNMSALRSLTTRLGQMGYNKIGLLLSYFICGLLGGYLETVPTSNVAAGASGALLGFVGMYIAILKRQGKEQWKQYFGYAILFLIIPLFIPIISFYGHLFGFIIGWTIGSTTWIDKYKG